MHEGPRYKPLQPEALLGTAGIRSRRASGHGEKFSLLVIRPRQLQKYQRYSRTYIRRPLSGRHRRYNTYNRFGRGYPCHGTEGMNSSSFSPMQMRSRLFTVAAGYWRAPGSFFADHHDNTKSSHCFDRLAVFPVHARSPRTSSCFATT